jgi:hypothetical protein
MKFTTIRDHRVHGYEATVGTRRAEIVRCYENQWMCFCYENGKIVGTGGKDRTYDPESEARKQARYFLRGGIAYYTAETQKNAVLDRLGLRPETEEQCPCPECACCCCEFIVFYDKGVAVGTANSTTCPTYQASNRRCECPRVPKKEKKCTSSKTRSTAAT